MSSLRFLNSLLARRTRRALVQVAAAGAVVRIAVIAAAREAGRGATTHLVFLGVAMAGFFAVQRYVQARARVRVEVDLLAAAARALVEGDVFGDTERDFQRGVFESEQHARGLLASAVPNLVSDALVAVGALVILAFDLPARLLVVSGVALVFVMGAVLALQRFTQSLQSTLLAALQAVYDRLLVAIEGRLEIIARGQERRFENELGSSLRRYATVADRVGVRSALLGRAPLVVGGAVLLSAVLLDGASRHALTGAMVADALLLASCLPPMVGVVVGSNDVIRLRSAAAPLVALAQRPPRPDRRRRGASCPPPPLDLLIEDVSFRYSADSVDVVVGVNRRVRSGQALFVEGPNGYGKSTFLRLLLGLHVPTRGRITVSGVDLQSLDLSSFRQSAAYLPQEPYLGEPYMTVGIALRIFSDVTDAALLEVLARVGVIDVLRSRPGEPLDVPIGTLSAGQRQRVALARVLASNASLVLLDEPDAYLDSAGVMLVARIIEELVAAGKTVAVAAHSPELAIPGAARFVVGGPMTKTQTPA